MYIINEELTRRLKGMKHNTYEPTETTLQRMYKSGDLGLLREDGTYL